MKIQITIDPDLPVPFCLIEVRGYGFLLGQNPGTVARMPTWLQEYLLNELGSTPPDDPYPCVEVETDNVIHLAELRQWADYLGRTVPEQRVHTNV